VKILNKLQEAFKNNVWMPDLLTKVDSDARWRAIDVIEEIKGIKIDWNWKDTDFTKLGCNPIVVEFSSTKTDKITMKKGLKIIQKFIKNTDYQIITGNNLVILIDKVEESSEIKFKDTIEEDLEVIGAIPAIGSLSSKWIRETAEFQNIKKILIKLKNGGNKNESKD
jgi:hypothetical protein